MCLYAFEVVADACGFGIGAVLLQDGRPVAFESRGMTSAECNYHIGEQELLAVVHAMRTWRCYLEGVKCTVVTDHNPITYLQTQPMLSRRQARWSEYLQIDDYLQIAGCIDQVVAILLTRSAGFQCMVHVNLLCWLH